MITQQAHKEIEVERIGGLEIVCGDCMDVMRRCVGSCADECARGEGGGVRFDLALSDPDYGLSRKLIGGQWAKKWGRDATQFGGVPGGEYFELLRRVSANQIVWGANYFMQHLSPTRCFLIWDKKEKTKTMADCELAWTSFDRNARTFISARNPGGITGKKRIHMTQKPVQLYIWILLNFAFPGCRVLDTHMGSGSSAIAVYEVNKWLRSVGCEPLTYTGIEINPRYWQDASERISRHVEAHPQDKIAPEIEPIVRKALGLEMLRHVDSGKLTGVVAGEVKKGAVIEGTKKGGEA